MPPRSAAAARRRHGSSARRPVAPRHPRRVSGPVARRVPAVALPGRAGAIPQRRTGAFERIRALPEHRLVDRLLRGRAWIWLVGIMLGGIVAMQVSLLKLNAGISRSIEESGALERQNADLEARVARLASGERISAAAIRSGMVTPPAGAVAYLTARPDRDARRAAQRMQPPSDEARRVMADGGRAPGLPALNAASGTGTSLPAAPGTAPAAGTAPGTTSAPAPGTTTAPAPGTTTAPAPGTTIAPAGPAPGTTQAAPPPGDPGTGAAAAPGGG